MVFFKIHTYIKISLKINLTYFRIFITRPGGGQEVDKLLKVPALSSASVCLNLPDNNIVVIDSGAERLVGQDAAVAYDDASFTAETARPESHMLVTQTTRWTHTQLALVSAHLSSSSPKPYAFVVLKMLSMILSANRTRRPERRWESQSCTHWPNNCVECGVELCASIWQLGAKRLYWYYAAIVIWFGCALINFFFRLWKK